METMVLRSRTLGRKAEATPAKPASCYQLVMVLGHQFRYSNVTSFR